MKNAFSKTFKLTALLTAFVVLFSGAMYTSGAYASVAIKKPEASVTLEKKAITQININEAGAKELSQYLMGIGLSKAKAIVSYREKNGKFTQLSDLAKVKGIGQATLDKNKKRIAF